MSITPLAEMVYGRRRALGTRRRYRKRSFGLLYKKKRGLVRRKIGGRSKKYRLKRRGGGQKRTKSFRVAATFPIKVTGSLSATTPAALLAYNAAPMHPHLAAAGPPARYFNEARSVGLETAYARGTSGNDSDFIYVGIKWNGFWCNLPSSSESAYWKQKYQAIKPQKLKLLIKFLNKNSKYQDCTTTGQLPIGTYEHMIISPSALGQEINMNSILGTQAWQQLKESGYRVYNTGHVCSLSGTPTQAEVTSAAKLNYQGEAASGAIGEMDFADQDVTAQETGTNADSTAGTKRLRYVEAFPVDEFVSQNPSSSSYFNDYQAGNWNKCPVALFRLYCPASDSTNIVQGEINVMAYGILKGEVEWGFDIEGNKV